MHTRSKGAVPTPFSQESKKSNSSRLEGKDFHTETVLQKDVTYDTAFPFSTSTGPQDSANSPPSKRKSEENARQNSPPKKLKQTHAYVVAASSNDVPQDNGSDGPSRSSSRSASPRGRGRGRGFGRGSGRGRGRGGRGAAGGGAPGGSRLQEISRDSSPSNSLVSQLKQRQREISSLFNAIAPLHSNAVELISTRTQNELKAKKHAHKKVPEYDEIEEALQEVLAKRKQEIEVEYNLKKKYYEDLIAREKAANKITLRAWIERIHDEHKLGAQGDYMAFMEATSGIEDDAGTEIEANSTALPFEHVAQVPNVEYRPRGFASKNIPRPDLLRKAAEGFDTFIQKDILTEELVPLIEKRELEAAEKQRRLSEDSMALANLAQAAEFLKKPQAAPTYSPPPRLPPPAIALHELADTALADAQNPRRFIPAQPPYMMRASSPPQNSRGRGRKPTMRVAPRTIAPAPTFIVSPMPPSRHPSFFAPPPPSQQQQYQQIMPAPPYHNQPALSVPRNPTPRTPRTLLPAPVAGPAGPANVPGGYQGP